MRIEDPRHTHRHGLVPIARPTRADFEVGAATGAGRRSQNEDHYLVADLDQGLKVWRSSVGSAHAELRHREGVSRMLLMVADGVGGHEGGERASAAVIRDVASSVAEGLRPACEPAELHRRLDAGLRRADRRVRTFAAGQDGHTPATTATVVCVDGPRLLIAHVGDSRCYLARGGRLTQLTSDHTLAAALHQASGAVNERFEHVLVNAIGGSEQAQPELQQVAVRGGDVLLLCTDGVSDVLDDVAMARILDASVPADELAGTLVDAAYEAGSPDNLTAVVARIR